MKFNVPRLPWNRLSIAPRRACSEAQVRIQEWPTDLPHSWPQPQAARVMRFLPLKNSTRLEILFIEAL